MCRVSSPGIFFFSYSNYDNTRYERLSPLARYHHQHHNAIASHDDPLSMGFLIYLLAFKNNDDSPGGYCRRIWKFYLFFISWLPVFVFFFFFFSFSFIVAQSKRTTIPKYLFIYFTIVRPSAFVFIVKDKKRDVSGVSHPEN